MTRCVHGLGATLVAACLLGCGPEGAPTGVGVDLEAGPCGRGVLVVGSDYQSTNLSVMGLDGAVLSSSLLSSGSEAPGLSAALSGDVVLPLQPQDGEPVLLDRFPAGVLSFVDVAEPGVRAQLSVATGFASNPQDYLKLSPSRAYVTRYGTNPDPGQEPLDAGGDLLAIDPAAATIQGRIDLAEAIADAPGVQPRPGRMVLRDGFAIVLLAAFDAGFTTSAPSRLARVDTSSDAFAGVHVLDGMHSCGGLALSPDASTVAVACSGRFEDGLPTGEGSGVVVLSFDTQGGLVEEARFAPDAIASRPVGTGIAFADDSQLLVTSYGEFGVSADVLSLLRWSDGVAETVLSSAEAFELGDVVCAGGPSSCAACFVADAGRRAVQRVVVGDDGGVMSEAFTPDDVVGLPPRGLGLL